ncbi:MAG: hypothetical protein ACI38Y_08015 [Candidatus Methanomethylophilaceae archaeon]
MTGRASPWWRGWKGRDPGAPWPSIIVRDDSLREETLGRIVDKYVPEPGRSDAKAGIPRAVGNMVALRLDIEHITGKYVDKPGR